MGDWVLSTTPFVEVRNGSAREVRTFRFPGRLDRRRHPALRRRSEDLQDVGGHPPVDRRRRHRRRGSDGPHRGHPHRRWRPRLATPGVRSHGADADFY